MNHAISRRLARTFSALLLLTILSGSLPVAPRGALARAGGAGERAVQTTLPPERKVFLPLLRVSPVSNRANISAANGGALHAPDGTVVEVAAQTFPEDGTLTYLPLPAATAPRGLRASSRSFSLEAATLGGQALHQFPRAISGRVPYRASEIRGISPASLAVYYFESTSQTWQLLPSQVDQAHAQVLFSTNHFSTFALMGAPLAVDSACVDAGVGQGAGETVASALCAAFLRAGGADAMGSGGTVVDQGAGQTQDFSGGSFGSSELVYRNDTGVAYFLAGGFADAYSRATGVNGFLGLPRSDSDQPAPSSYKDEAHDFTGGPIALFDYGFIGTNSMIGSVEAHRHFPRIKQATWDADWIPTGTHDDQDRPYYHFVVRGGVQDAEANPGGREGDHPDLAAGFRLQNPDGSDIYSNFFLGIGDTDEFAFPGEYTDNQIPEISKTQYRFFLGVYRFDVDDGLEGYYPCNHAYVDPADKGWITLGMYPTQLTLTQTCTADGGGGGFDAPPQLSITETWPDGQGNLAVMVRATDDIGIASVTLKVQDGDGTADPAMQLWPASGPDIYAGTIRNVPPSKKIHFTVTAVDTHGWSVTVDQDNRVLMSAFCGVCQTGQGYEGDPVNTATGNATETLVDLVVPGRGGTDLALARSVNSQDERDGPFGRGTSLLYDVGLQVVNNPLLQGVQIRYGDGHTANFKDERNGRYSPVSPTNFDELTAEGGGYVLHRTDRSTYHFDGNGKLTEIRNPNGSPITLGYDGQGLLHSATNASGRSISFDWSGGHITAVHAPEGLTVGYNYNGALLTGVTDADGHTTTYQYDADGRMTAIITPNGSPKMRQGFDDRGRVTWQIVGEQERRDFVYDDASRTTTVTDANGHSTTYVYDQYYLLAAVIDANGATEHYSYDERGNLRLFTDRRGFTWSYDYDEQGNRIRQTDPVDGYSAAFYGSDTTTWTYNGAHQPTSSTDARGFVTRYAYDAQGNRTDTYLPDGAHLRGTFNSDGQPLAVTDGRGNTTSYTYDPATGDLSALTDAEGHTTRFGYDSLGRQTSITDANGHTVQMAYSGTGKILSVTDAKGRVSTFQYDANGNQTDSFDRTGGHIHKDYDHSDRLIAETDAVGVRTSYRYDPMGHLLATTNPRGFTTTNQYDAVYNLTATQDTGGFWTRYEYDANHNRTAVFDAKGQRSTLVYDAVNRLKFSTDPLGHTTEYCYNALDQLIASFDPRRAETRFLYDPLGRLARTINALGETQDFAYDQAGNLTAQTNGEGQTTRFGYDRANRRVSTTNALTETVATSYDGVGNPTAVKDVRGFTTRYAYDENNNLVRITDALSGVVTLAYDDEDRRASVRDAAGSTSSYTYFADGSVRQTSEPGGAVTQFVYDPNKNLIQRINALGRTSVRSYDARDLLLSESDPLGQRTSYRYDELARLVAKTDANGKTYQYAYDPAGRLIGVTDPLSGTTSYRHDEVGNTTWITATNGVTTSFTFNFLNQLVRETDALNHTWRYDYDRAGRLVRRVDGVWRDTSYAYDAAGRLVATRFGAGGRRVDMRYDANGNPVEMRDWNGTLTRTFDALNRPVAVTDYLSQTLRYAWNPDGTRASLTYPDGRVLSATYDLDKRLDTLTLPGGQRASYAYNALGQTRTISYSNGTRADYAYDQADRLTGLHTSGPDALPIAWYDFVLDKVGNRSQTGEVRLFAPHGPPVTLTRRYTYDDLYRLVRSTSEGGQQHDTAWTLDSAGNWQARAGTPEPTAPLTATATLSSTYSHSPINALVRAGAWTYRYDANGNRVAATAPLSATQYAALTPTFGLSATLVVSYAYDFENHLADMREAISHPVSGTLALSPTVQASYRYDGLGRRVEALVTTAISASGVLSAPTALRRAYVFDGLDPVAEREWRDGQPAGATDYYHAGGRIVALEHTPISGTAALRWFHYDALGSAVALTDDQGALATAYRYDEYGRLLAGDTALNRYTFTGQEWDAESGTYHFYARAYDPTNGVWLEQDSYRGSMDDPLSMERYVYVNNNPNNNVDMFGFAIQMEINDIKPIIYHLASKYKVPPEAIALVLDLENKQGTSEGGGRCPKGVDNNYCRQMKQILNFYGSLSGLKMWCNSENGQHDCSLGVGNVKVGTAKKIIEYFRNNRHDGECYVDVGGIENDNDAVLTRLLVNDQINAEFVAANLRMAIDQIKGKGYEGPLTDEEIAKIVQHHNNAEYDKASDSYYNDALSLLEKWRKGEAELQFIDRPVVSPQEQIKNEIQSFVNGIKSGVGDFIDGLTKGGNDMDVLKNMKCAFGGGCLP